jgi:hypothetical protein
VVAETTLSFVMCTYVAAKAQEGEEEEEEEEESDIDQGVY